MSRVNTILIIAMTSTVPMPSADPREDQGAPAPILNPTMELYPDDETIFVTFGERIDGNRELNDRFITSFLLDGVLFKSVRQYLQYKKAEIFNDRAAMMNIRRAGHYDLTESSWDSVEITGFDAVEWERVCMKITIASTLAKFTSDKRYIQSTPPDKRLHYNYNHSADVDPDDLIGLVSPTIIDINVYQQANTHDRRAASDGERRGAEPRRR